MKIKLTLLLTMLTAPALADRLGSLRSNADVLLTTQAVAGGGGSGYAVEPATVTFNLAKGVTASTITATSTTTLQYTTIKGAIPILSTGTLQAGASFYVAQGTATDLFAQSVRYSEGLNIGANPYTEPSVFPYTTWFGSGKVQNLWITSSYTGGLSVISTATPNGSVTPFTSTLGNPYSSSSANFSITHSSSTSGTPTVTFSNSANSAAGITRFNQFQTSVWEMTGSSVSVTNVPFFVTSVAGSTITYGLVAGSVTVSDLASGQCVQTGTGGRLTVTGSACGAGGGSSGASSLAIATGTLAGFTIPGSSPTAVINLSSSAFTSTPTGSATSYIDLTTAYKTGRIGASWDGGGSTLLTGTTYWVVIPASATITNIRMTVRPSGTFSVIVSSATDFDFTKAGNICTTGACPSIVSGTMLNNSTLTSWTKQINKDGYLFFVSTQATTVTQANISVEYAKP